MVLTYPLQLFVFRDTIEKQFFKGRPFSKVRHTIITVCAVLSTVMIACLTCDLSIIIEITGGVAGALIALVVPSSCWLKIHQMEGKALTMKQKIPHYMTIALGCALMIMTVVNQVMKRLDTGVGHSQCVWGSW